MIIHTASWCPDCTRELKLVDDFLKKLKHNSPKVSYIKEYEDKEKYKEDKKNYKLKIKALPTILIYDENEKQIASIIEKSDKELINYFS